MSCLFDCFKHFENEGGGAHFAGLGRNIELALNLRLRIFTDNTSGYKLRSAFKHQLEFWLLPAKSVVPRYKIQLLYIVWGNNPRFPYK
jgi:hypothetical protein